MDKIKIEVNGIDLIDLINKIDNLTQVLSIEKKKEVDNKDRLMTRQEVANLFGVTLPTIHDWSSKKILNPYRIGRKVRYKESEVKEALKQIR